MAQAPKAVAVALGVTAKTVNKGCERFQAEGASGLLDRSSRPHRLRQPTPDTTLQRIAALRRQRWTGDQIATEVDARRPPSAAAHCRTAGAGLAWLHRYNWHRPHGGIKSQTSISRLGLAEDNLLGLHS